MGKKPYLFLIAMLTAVLCLTMAFSTTAYADEETPETIAEAVIETVAEITSEPVVGTAVEAVTEAVVETTAEAAQDQAPANDLQQNAAQEPVAEQGLKDGEGPEQEEQNTSGDVEDAGTEAAGNGEADEQRTMVEEPAETADTATDLGEYGPVIEKSFDYSITFTDTDGNSTEIAGGQETGISEILKSLGYEITGNTVITVEKESVDTDVINVTDTGNGYVITDNGVFGKANKNLVVFIDGQRVEIEIEDPNLVCGSVTADDLRTAFNGAAGTDTLNVKLTDNVTIDIPANATDEEKTIILSAGTHELFLETYTLDAKGAVFNINDGVTLNIYGKDDSSTTGFDGRITNATFNINGGVMNYVKGTLGTECAGTDTATLINYGGAVTEAADMPGINNSGYYFLADDISLNYTWDRNAGSSIYLDLNGKVLTRKTGSLINNNGTLTLTDSCDGLDTAAHSFTVNAKTGLWTLTETGGTETVKGGVITGLNTLFDNCVYNAGIFEMNGGAIIGNFATSSSYSVLYNTGKFSMSGGKITGNTATDGSGVYNTGMFVMRGGTVSSNTAADRGGGVYNTGKFIMSGGTISSNTAADGGGVYNFANGGATEFTMNGGCIGNNNAGIKGTPGIKNEDGTVSVTCGYFTDNNKPDSNFYTGSLIGACNATLNGITYNWKVGKAVAQLGDDTEKQYATVQEAINRNPGSSASSATIRMIGDSLENVILDNVSATDQAKFIILDLNGHVLQGTESGSVITIAIGSDLTLEDGKANNPVSVHNEISGGIITGGKSAHGGGGVYNSGTFLMRGGTICGNTAIMGGGVYNAGTFLMRGGTICGNTATDGGGVYNFANGDTAVFTMNGGRIGNNTADSNGNSGITNLAGTVSISDGYFTKNNEPNPEFFTGFLLGSCNAMFDGIDYERKVGKAVAQLGEDTTKQYATVQEAINQNPGLSDSFTTIKMIGDSTETLDLHRVYDKKLYPEGKDKFIILDLNGHVLQGTDCGSTIIISKDSYYSHLTLKDSKADDSDSVHYFRYAPNGAWTLYTGTAAPAGNVINLSDFTPDQVKAETGTYYIKVSGGVITGGIGTYTNIAGMSIACGGGVWNKGTFVMLGGTIIGNTATYGGGVYNDGTFKMSDGTICGNTATYGGGVCSSCSFEMSGGNINGNTAASGGGVYNFTHGGPAKFTMSGGNICGNTAVNDGGGVYNFDNSSPKIRTSTFTMNGGTISGNTAANGIGGGVCNYKGPDGGKADVMMSGGFVGNNTDHSGYPGIANLSGTVSVIGGYFTDSNKPEADFCTGSLIGAYKITTDGITYNWKVGKAVAQLGEDATKQYATLQEAINRNPGSSASSAKIKMIDDSAENLILEKVSEKDSDKFIILDLNGHVLKGIDTGSVVTIKSGSKLTLEDSRSNDSDGMITGGTANDGGGVLNSGTFEMNGGTVSGSSAVRGGGVYNAGTFGMNGGTVSGNSAVRGGGVFNSGTFEMNGGTVSGNSADDDGGGIYNFANDGTAKFTMSAGYIGNNTDGNGIPGIANPDGTVSVTGGYFTDNNKPGAEYYTGSLIGACTAIFDGITYNWKIGKAVAQLGEDTTKQYATVQEAINRNPGSSASSAKIKLIGDSTENIILKKVNAADTFKFILLDLNGHALKGTDSGSVITITGGSVLTLEDGQANDSGSVHNEVSGGVITGGHSTYGGGGVYNAGTFEMRSGSISGNSAICGGGVFNAGTFGMLGGTIRDNTATDGGGVYNVTYDCTAVFTMSGGCIGNNNADNHSNSGIKNAGGTVSVIDGYFTANNKPDPEYYTGSLIGACTAIFDGITYNWKVGKAVAQLDKDTAKQYATVQEAINRNPGSSVSSARIKMIGDSLENVILDNVNSTEQDKFIILDLNSHILKGTESGSVITVNSGSSLTLDDSKGNDSDGMITGGTGNFTNISGMSTVCGGGVWNSGMFAMKGGTIAGNSTEIKYGYGGGGVYNSGTFKMSGGIITGNKATKGGGGVWNSGTFEMSAGTISGNTADYGGGVYNFANNNTVEFTMSGGTVTGNTANIDGGGVCNYAQSGTAEFTMSGGTVTGNSTAYNGGGVCNQTYDGTTKFTMNGGTITGNTANDGGGGVLNQAFNGKAEFILSGTGAITCNKAKSIGGGVYNLTCDPGEAVFTMTDGSITGNQAESTGGGVYNAGTFNMTGGEITGNTSRYYGGGVYLCSTSDMTAGGTVQITGNTADSKADNLFLANSANLKISSTIPFTGDASIGVTTQNKPVMGMAVDVTSNGTAGDRKYFFSDSNAYTVVHEPNSRNTASIIRLAIPVAKINDPPHIGNGVENGPVVEKISIPVSTGEDTVHVTPAARNGVVTFDEVPSEEIIKIVSNALPGQNVTVDLSSTQRTITTVALPVALMRVFAAKSEKGDKDLGLTVKVSAGAVTLDDTALNAAVTAAEHTGTFTIAVEKVEKFDNLKDPEKYGSKIIACVDCYILTGSTKVRELNGGSVKLTLSAKLYKGYNVSSITLCRLAENGTMTRVEFETDEDGNLVFSPAELGNYVIMTE